MPPSIKDGHEWPLVKQGLGPLDLLIALVLALIGTYRARARSVTEFRGESTERQHARQSITSTSTSRIEEG